MTHSHSSKQQQFTGAFYYSQVSHASMPRRCADLQKFRSTAKPAFCRNASIISVLGILNWRKKKTYGKSMRFS